MYCSFCGEKLANGAAFCSACGKKVAVIEKNPKESKNESVKTLNLDPSIGEGDRFQAVTLSDKFVWMMAIIPLLVSMGLPIIPAFQTADKLQFVIVVILYGIFIILDENELKEAGFDCKKWFILGIILVPIYLFIRELKTNRNFVPFIIYMFLFAVSVFIL